MALTPCVECKHEISSEAKTCPNCGAKNRAYVSTMIWPWYLLIASAIGGGIFLGHLSKSNQENITNCDTADNRETFASLINESAEAQLNKLHVIDITKMKTVKSGDSYLDLVCEATINFNSLKKRKYRFTYSESESGALLIEGKVIH